MERIADRTKYWKLSEMDMSSRSRWIEYSKAKDEMFAYTDTKTSPWWVVEADDKRKARLNCIHHLLGMIPYQEIKYKKIKLPPINNEGYVRPPITDQTFVPEVY
jgi:polyphosphate kinase 2 (PPK2 family)